jgi:dTDP-4-amino-4,6-dideoxygalactose transaminase
MGIAAAFSFYPGKNLGACGEAGAVVTNDGAIEAITRRLRDHGQTKKYHHEIEGYNGRLDAIQAGLLHVKLGHLQRWNSARRLRAAEYNRMLASNKAVICPYEPAWSRAVYHLYVIRTGDRDRLISYLKERGIGTGIHYPVPLHFQKAYAAFDYIAGDFPVTERVASEILSLPMFPELTADQQATVGEAIKSFTGQDFLAASRTPRDAAVQGRANCVTFKTISV